MIGRALRRVLPAPDSAPPAPAGPAPRTADALLRRIFARHRGRLVVGLGLISLWQVCEALVPVAIGLIIDHAVATGDLVYLGLSGLGLCLLFAVLSFSYRGGARIIQYAIQAESHRLRGEVAGHVLSPTGARTGALPGEVLALATGDADRATMVLHQASQACAAIFGLGVAVVLLVRIDPLLGLTVAVGTPLVLLLSQSLAPRLQRRTVVAQERIATASGLATDLLAGLRPLRGIGGEAAALRRYRRASADAAQAGVATAGSRGLLLGVTSGASMLFLAVVALIAGLRAAEGHLSIGEMIAVVGLAQFLAEPLQMVATLVAALAASRASAGRVVDFVATPPAERHGEVTAPSSTELVVRTDGRSVRVPPGELVGVVTDDPRLSGALVALLTCTDTPDDADSGALLGGVPLDRLELAARRRTLLVAAHRVDLFAGRLVENLDPHARLSGDELDRALRASAGDAVVEVVPDGLEARVAAHGTSLSGGQQQRVGLARVLGADPPVLVLEEPTTAVDAVTEQRIAHGLRALRHRPGSDRSTLAITTSPALLAVADRVVVLRAGEPAVEGTHAGLLADDAAYRELVLR